VDGGCLLTRAADRTAVHCHITRADRYIRAIKDVFIGGESCPVSRVIGSEPTDDSARWVVARSAEESIK